MVSGKAPKELANQPPCPIELGYLWDWFKETGTECSNEGLLAWAQLTGRQLQPYEIQLLRWMAGAFVKALRGET